MLYTSGSTGTPKGVEITRRALANLLAGMREILGAASPAGEVWLASTSVSFDISGLELFLPLVSGQCVVLAGDDQVGDADELIGLIRKHGVTHVQATPSGWKVLLGAGLDPAGLTLLAGGEALPLELAGRLRARAERLVHVYGPTETTIWSTAVDMPFDPANVPLGIPIRNTAVHVLDGHLNPVPSGVAGELFIAGDGLAQGYRGHAALTAERFLPNPYGPPGTRLYRTGDLVRRTLTGELEYLGRSDDQLKIRGYRIEPAEIETALRSHPQVSDAHVTAVPDHTDEPRLTAYVIAAAELGLDEVRRHLRQSLPEYMLPAAVVTLDGWPLTAAGKLDRAALPAPELVSRDRVEPRTDTERRLAAVWAEALSADHVGVHDSFFDLGGDSIRAVVLVGTARAAGLDLAVRDIFEHPTIAELAQHITGDSAESAGHVFVEPFALIGESDRAALPADVVDAYPISQLQLGMVVEMSRADGPPVYHNVEALHIRDEAAFDTAAFSAAATALVARHEALRTGFELVGYSLPLQLVHRDGQLPTAVDDLRGIEPEEFPAALRHLTEREAAHGFAGLATPPLVRIRAVLDPTGTWWLLLTHAHALFEGWSYRSFIGELLMTYQAMRDGRAVEPPTAGEARYADFIAGELESLADEGDQEYWRSVVERCSPFALPSGWGDDDGSSRATHVVEVPFGDLESGLRGLASSTRTSLKSVLFAAHLKVLSQLTPEDSFTTGLVCDARPELLGADRVYGMHLNTVPFVFDRTAGTWAELVRQVFGREAELWPHRRFPLPAIQRLAHNRQVPDVYFNYQDYQQVDRKLVDGGVGVDDSPAEFPLTVSSRGGSVFLKGDGRSVSRAHVERLGVMFRLVLESMAAGGAGDARAVFVPPGELSTVTGVTGASADVLDAFAAQVASVPDAVAVVAGGMQVSFAELDARSDRLACHLRSLGVGPGGVVGVLVERSPELLVALLAVLKSGAGYLPLDAAFPAGRLTGIVADAKPVVVVTQEVHAHTARTVHPGTIVVLDGVRDSAAIDSQPAGGTWTAMSPDALAYVLYTSGSTGTPKGVEVTRGALANLLAGMRELLGAASPAGEMWLASTSVSFDISGLELFLPLVGGQCVVLAGDDQVGNADELISLIRKHGVTHVQATPSGWKVLLAAGLDPTGLTLLAGGEALPLELAGQLRARAERLIHVYGPTETTIWSTAVDIPADPANVPLGAPIRNTTVHVLDGHLNPVPSGVTGELFIAGDGLAQGYRGHATLTAERFLPNPYGPPGTRLYRTGDLVRRTLTGELEYLGRSDDQLKIRGYRIEPAEIETALRNHPQVRDAHVTAVAGHTDEPRLTAYVIAASELGLDEARRHLRQSLPEYMLPTAVVTLASWPLTAAGKLDRTALPAPDHTGQDITEPRTDTERRLAAVWSEALGLARVGVNETFFDLGGDSIRAVVLVGTARAAGL
ncbi:amino acid adenylation domain-containing protein, partial [Kitasatospora sp. NPDC097643]|uniref:amino acid adenylation domain-containing protein n=1 Tax=Kitasatospora sp. NPDC097643 TaxID=3157230 RepID=UPI00331A94B0